MEFKRFAEVFPIYRKFEKQEQKDGFFDKADFLQEVTGLDFDIALGRVSDADRIVSILTNEVSAMRKYSTGFWYGVRYFDFKKIKGKLTVKDYKNGCHVITQIRNKILPDYFDVINKQSSKLKLNDYEKDKLDEFYNELFYAIFENADSLAANFLGLKLEKVQKMAPSKVLAAAFFFVTVLKPQQTHLMSTAVGLVQFRSLLRHLIFFKNKTSTVDKAMQTR